MSTGAKDMANAALQNLTQIFPSATSATAKSRPGNVSSRAPAPARSHSEALASALHIQQSTDPLNATIMSSASNTSNGGPPEQPFGEMGGTANSNFSATGGGEEENPGEAHSEQAELYPHSALTCVWSEATPTSASASNTSNASAAPLPRADSVFTASGLSGQPLLCLHSRANSTLRVLELSVDPVSGAVAMAEHEVDLPCLSAVPIVSGSSEHSPVDILVLNIDHSLSLYRGSHLFASCDLGLSSAARVLNIKFAVHDRVTVEYSEGGATRTVRARLSLSLADKSPLAETCLAALGSTLPPVLAAAVRADCVRASQYILGGGGAGAGGLSFSDLEDPGFVAVSAVLRAILNGLSTRSTRSSRRSRGSSGGAELGPGAGGGSAFEKLVKSDYHERFMQNNPIMAKAWGERAAEKAAGKSSSTATPFVDHLLANLSFPSVEQFSAFDAFSQLSTMFDTLHLVYEDAKLSLTCWAWLKPMAQMLSGLASAAGVHCADFLDHYARDQEFAVAGKGGGNPKPVPRKSLTTFETPPCILNWLVLTMVGEVGVFPAAPPCDTTRRICRFYSILFDSENQDLVNGIGCSQGEGDMSTAGSMGEGGVDMSGASNASATPPGPYKAHERVVLAMLDEGVGHTELANIPPGVALPILEAINKTRQAPPANWPSSAYGLIWREDLARMQDIKSGVLARPKPTSAEARFLASTGGVEGAGAAEGEEEAGEDKDGLELVDKFSSMLFPNDHRVKEVGRLLRSSQPLFLKVERAPEVSDHEHEQRKQTKLMHLCNRNMAVPIGRGMLTLGTLVTPLLAEALPIPEMCLAGKVPPSNAIMKLDTTACDAMMKAWPEFHNGVAAGLRLGSAATTKGVSRTWIVYNKPSAAAPPPANANQPNPPPDTATPNYAHGGLLMALGLRGHLGALAMTDIYEYLTMGIDTTTVGVLLGMAATKRASCDASVSKMLCLHIPSLLPPPFTEMDVSSVAQIAAVAGVGLLYEGSAHRLMTEFLLGEIGRKPSSDKIADREGYVLASGLALGMVNLGRGDNMGGLSGLMIEERLTRYMVGGRDEGVRGGGGVGGRGGGEEHKCSRIFEGEYVNVDVTAPGATLGLGLIYLRSGNRAVAARLALPQTGPDLDDVRPDFLLYRVVARSLVMWDEIEPTEEWVEEQIPKVVSRVWAGLGEISSVFGGFGGVVLVGGEDEGEEEEEDKEAKSSGGGARKKGRGKGKGKGRGKEKEKQEEEDSDVDKMTAKQVFVHVVAGTCFSLGLRFAGTGDERAKKAVLKQLLMLKKLREENDRVTVARRPAKYMVDMCLGCAAVSLAMIMSGTGDLECLKIFRDLRTRCDADVTYGCHMSFGSALGLLYLGGGGCTLGRSNSDVAALLVSFFPRWPISTTDNCMSLQALRHLYVLAVKEKAVECVDVDSGVPVFVPILLKSEGGETEERTAPCLVNGERGGAGGNVEVWLNSGKYHQIQVSDGE
ncbi:hypothetical protein TeGR_g303, partial [Tetraparma gracilis]